MPNLIPLASKRLGPRKVALTGDDSPAKNVFGYVRRMTGAHQFFVCLLAVAIAPLNLVPVELQRRIVDDIVELQNLQLLVVLGFAYAIVVVVHQAAKFALRLAQSWLTESAVIYTRRHLMEIRLRKQGEKNKRSSGQAVSVIGPEVDKLGEFVGTGPSQAAANITTLTLILSYMIYMEPRIGLICLAFLIPQALLIPLIQRRLNQLAGRRLDLLRSLGDAISDPDSDYRNTSERLLPRIYRNKMRFNAIKFGMKSLQNGLTALPIIFILVSGGYLVIVGQTTIGIVVAFMAGYERTTGPFRELIAFYRTAAQANVQHAKIAQWM